MNLSLIKWLLNSSTCQHHRNGLLKYIFLGSTPKFSDLVSVGWVPRIWISNKFLNDVHVIDLENSILWAFWICRQSFHQIWKFFGHYFSKYFFFSVPTPLSPPSSYTYIRPYEIVPQPISALFIFFSLWFLCFILVSTIMSSSSLIFSFAMPYLLLVPLGVVFISNTVPSFFRCSIWVFLYLPCLYSTWSVFIFLNIWNAIIVTEEYVLDYWFYHLHHCWINFNWLFFIPNCGLYFPACLKIFYWMIHMVILPFRMLRSFAFL